MYQQLTPDEYDLAIAEAERDLAIGGIGVDDETVSNRKFITGADFFKDSKKVSRKIGDSKASLKRSRA